MLNQLGQINNTEESSKDNYSEEQKFEQYFNKINQNSNMDGNKISLLELNSKQ